AYNEEDSIEKTLISLKNQKTKVPYEIIVCDNNSTDKTFKIAKKIADKAVKEKKQGSMFARNTGVRHSVGKYLVHTDADTIFPNNFIQEACRIFKTNKYVGFTCGNWNYCEDKKFSMKFKSWLWGALYSLFLRIQSLRNVVTLPGWCICTPRRIFEKVKGFEERKDYFEDLLYSYKIDYLGNFKYFFNIKVKSSSRRFNEGIMKFIRHYSKRNAKLRDLFILLTRKKYSKPFKA
ncbi:MAG: glycosyltransferase family A protein, partial [Candidatus Nanoarchaeia archaeon]|nr:glycosyltransferase family A protein [Candidatus Nanoarchaeia archaeon]